MGKRIESKNGMREVLKWAEAAGIERPRIESRSTGRHPRLVGTIGGKPYSQVIPGTPGAGRGTENLRAQFKRAVRTMTMESA